MDSALLVLQREAEYQASQPPRPGLFVYQFEVLSRNRLGYDGGLRAMAADPFYDADWRAFLDDLRRQVGLVDFADILFLRSDMYVQERRRQEPDYEPPVPPLFGEKEGKIARANRGRDPLYLFAALQRQLNYPEVPRPRPPDDMGNKVAGAGRTLARDGEAAEAAGERSARAGRFEPVRQAGIVRRRRRTAGVSRLVKRSTFRTVPRRRRCYTSRLTPAVRRIRGYADGRGSGRRAAPRTDPA